MSERKWRYCGTCLKWRQVEDMQCPACGGAMSMGKITREQKPADPRVQGPVANQERKPL